MSPGGRGAAHQVRLVVGVRVLAGRVVRRVGPGRGRVTRGVAAGLGLPRALPAGSVVEVERVGGDRVAAPGAATGRRLGPGRRGVGVDHDRRDPHGRPGGEFRAAGSSVTATITRFVFCSPSQRQQRAALVAPGDVAVEGSDDRPATRADREVVRPGLHLGRRARAGGEHQRLGQVGAHREVASGHLVAGILRIARGRRRGGQGQLAVRERGEAVDLGLGLLHGDLVLLRPHRRAAGGTEHPHRRSDADGHQGDGDQDLDQREAVFPPHVGRAAVGSGLIPLCISTCYPGDASAWTPPRRSGRRPGKRVDRLGGLSAWPRRCV